MLHELRIEDLLLIERAELRFERGLNAITGETGAGKTILAHSLDLLMGGKARPQIVRPGASEAYVEGVFALPPDLLEEPELAELRERLPPGSDEILLGRRISTSGRTSAFVQGRGATAADLRALGSRLLAFYGQHEHRRLVLAGAQLEILDGFVGSDHVTRLARYREAQADVLSLTRELAVLQEREGARERDLDLLRFEVAEIEAARPNAEEERELEGEHERLRHAERLRAGAGEALAALCGADDDGAGALLGAAEAQLAAVKGLDRVLDPLGERVRSLAIELDDAAGALRSYLEAIDGEPGRLQEVEERLHAVDRLKRKHGGSVEAVLSHAERCRADIARLESSEERAEELEGRLDAAVALRACLAGELSEARARAARELEKRVRAELAELAMEGASLAVSLEPHPEGFGPKGSETVELLIATNPGIEPSPLRDAASGGELSRIMLALIDLGQAATRRTLVFDEVDAGIGGHTANTVGDRLRRLGDDRQVICITHLPQIASHAAAHFRIEKSTTAGQARATVERVDGEELVAEIVRMLGGERDDEAARRHARELLAA